MMTLELCGSAIQELWITTRKETNFPNTPNMSLE